MGDTADSSPTPPSGTSGATAAGEAKGWPRWLVLALYNLLLPIGILASLPGFVIKMLRRGGYARGFATRFALYGSDLPRACDLWVHAVSVGEMNVALKLIAALRAIDPACTIALSTTTSTGMALARERAPSGVYPIYNPLDFPPVALAALRRLRPRQLILVEAEVWPNLAALARWRGIPVSLVNARLSPRSERRYAKFRALTAPIFGLLSRAFVQEADDVARFAALGIDPRFITVAGSVKYDLEGADHSPEQEAAFRELIRRLWGEAPGPLLLAASTHAGEEAWIAGALPALRESVPGLKFLAAPRHFERAHLAMGELRAAGCTPALRSAAGQGDAAPEGCDTLVIDSTGELRAWQALADAVVVGKSFLSHGGQNPAEAAALGKPVLFGPHMENFAPLVADLLKAGGAIQTPADPEALAAALRRVFTRAGDAAELGARAKATLEKHRGATRRTAEALLPK
ncbi:MAG: glycosyltransferase N-terminal domain-containing protein [Verrucomicrobiales bacterium]